MAANVNENLLQRRWLHAHEEDSPGLAVFRPETHPLPPARGRTGYEFLPGGRLVRIGPGPTDRTLASQGTWTLDAQGRVIVQIPGQSEEVLEISTLDADRLVVKR
jgi:hypothetical protein